MPIGERLPIKTFFYLFCVPACIVTPIAVTLFNKLGWAKAPDGRAWFARPLARCARGKALAHCIHALHTQLAWQYASWVCQHGKTLLRYIYILGTIPCKDRKSVV